MIEGLLVRRPVSMPLRDPIVCASLMRFHELSAGMESKTWIKHTVMAKDKNTIPPYSTYSTLCDSSVLLMLSRTAPCTHLQDPSAAAAISSVLDATRKDRKAEVRIWFFVDSITTASEPFQRHQLVDVCGSCMFLRKTSKYIRDYPNLWGESPLTEDLFNKKKCFLTLFPVAAWLEVVAALKGLVQVTWGCELHQLSAPVSAFSHLTSSKCIKMHCDIIFRYGFVMVCPKMLHIDIYIILIYIIHRCARMKKARMMINHDKPSNLRYTSFNQTHMLIGFSCSCSGMSCNIN